MSEDPINELHAAFYNIADPTAAQGRFAFARAIERESTASLIERIKEDEALMRKVLNALPSALPCGEFHHKAKDRHGIGEPCRPVGLYVEALYLLHQRLKEKK